MTLYHRIMFKFYTGLMRWTIRLENPGASPERRQEIFEWHERAAAIRATWREFHPAESPESEGEVNGKKR